LITLSLYQEAILIMCEVKQDGELCSTNMVVFDMLLLSLQKNVGEPCNLKNKMIC
jgi:hypothetical protein